MLILMKIHMIGQQKFKIGEWIENGGRVVSGQYSVFSYNEQYRESGAECESMGIVQIFNSCNSI